MIDPNFSSSLDDAQALRAYARAMERHPEAADALMRVRFGAHLFGTATPQSDLDIKAVFVPRGEAILVGRLPKVVSVGPGKAAGVRNTAGDVDVEAYSLAMFLGLLAEGQTNAVDMFFAPDAAMIAPADARWAYVQQEGRRLLSRKMAAFIGYCRQQAHKYNAKADRLAAAQRALAVLEEALRTHGTTARLAAAEAVLRPLVDGQLIDIVDIAQVSGKTLPHLSVCGRKASFTGSLKTAHDVLAGLVAEYGERAHAAASGEGIDWKSMSHAVRVAHEAIELLTTGGLVFPLASAAHILAVKQGRVPYETVAAEIEALVGEVEAAQAKSSLREAPDLAAIDDILLALHGQAAAAFLAGAAA